MPRTPESRSPAASTARAAVLAGQAELERLDPRGEGVRARARPPAPAVRRACTRAVGRGEPVDGGLVLLVEADLALVEPGDLGLERVEVGVRLVGAGAGVGGLGGAGARARPRGPRGGRSRRGPGRRGAPGPRDGRRRRARAAVSRCSSAAWAPSAAARAVTASASTSRAAATSRPSVGLLLARGARPRRRAPRGRGRAAPPRARGRGGAPARRRGAAVLARARAATTGGTRSPGRAASAGCLAGHLGSSTASRAWAPASSDSTSPRRSRSAVSSATSCWTCVPQVDEVVGEEPQSGVAQVGLDHRGAAGDLGLLAQRLELAAQLGGEVLQAREVGLHRVELAERLLLALAVLEDAGRLLDEAAAVLGRGGEDLVELALADDDVHLAADAGVGQQLLDVEQPARVAVDGVLGPAVAEHRPRDRDLGVVDRQRAVVVVDREQHLGPAERRAAGGAGEDDVLHLAAAQRSWRPARPSPRRWRRRRWTCPSRWGRRRR